MKNRIYLVNLLIIGLIINISACKSIITSEIAISPNGKIEVAVETYEGQLYYSVKCDTQTLVNKSKLGFQFKDQPELGNSMVIKNSTRTSVNETWEQVWGEKRLVENRYEELIVNLEESKDLKRKLTLTFRVFNDGVGFRYHIPVQENIDTIIITNELTQFSLAPVSKAWWIPAYKAKFYESLYHNTALADMDTVSAPLTLEMKNGKFVTIHEANLTDYAAMNLYYSEPNILNCDLTPWSTGEKVFGKAGMVSPWRIITVGNNPGDLITSYIALNLNEPNKIEDTSWIKPGKYIGIWWSIHMGKHSWSQGPIHGATTKNTKEYIDFASENGFNGVLVEGWNNGWDFDWTANGNQISFTEAYPDFDLREITRYGASKGVKLIGHHETGGAVINYESQMEDAFKLYQSLNVTEVKTGYVNLKGLDAKEFHSSQYGVRHFRKVIETAAKYQIVIDNHEAVMPTGLQRTYPNLMTQEAVRGQEFDAWSTDGGNPPEHTTILPFTRGLAGPMDFTFGTFNFENAKVPQTRVQTTIAKQLALYVVIYSPLQMASDLPENYKGKKEFDFIKDVPVDWAETKVLDAKIGDYIATARKDRNSDDWFLGAITDENSCELTVKLDFLDPNKTYKAEIYKDGENADWKSNPYDFAYEEILVKATDNLVIKMADGGGQAIRFALQN